MKTHKDVSYYYRGVFGCLRRSDERGANAYFQPAVAPSPTVVGTGRAFAAI